MNSVQTDNSFFEVKVKLRLDNLPAGPCRVLDCFGGTGRIWDEIKRRKPNKKIEVLRIDQKNDIDGIYLKGKNEKFLAVLEPDDFTVIDLDAYGVPYKQLQWLFAGRNKKRKVIFLTFIQNIFGCLPTGLLMELGYTAAMIDKCPTLFYRNGFEKLADYLALHGVKTIRHYSDLADRKHYVCFDI